MFVPGLLCTGGRRPACCWSLRPRGSALNPACWLVRTSRIGTCCSRRAVCACASHSGRADDRLRAWPLRPVRLHLRWPAGLYEMADFWDCWLVSGVAMLISGWTMSGPANAEACAAYAAYAVYLSTVMLGQLGACSFWYLCPLGRHSLWSPCVR